MKYKIMNTFDNKRVSFEKPFTDMKDLVVFQYTWENGYKQSYIADDSMGEPGTEYFVSLLSQFYNFRRIIREGGNSLYAAYSKLDKGYINQETGEPLIELDFEDADIFLQTGKLPSVEKLNQNERSKGTLKVDTKKLEELF